MHPDTYLIDPLCQFRWRQKRRLNLLCKRLSALANAARGGGVARAGLRGGVAGRGRGRGRAAEARTHRLQLEEAQARQLLPLA